MSSSLTTKLHPIYVALDAHQYSRAVKLASALPKTNTLGQALLAVALMKSGQRYKCLQTLQSLLPHKCYYEIHRALEKCPEHHHQVRATAPAPQTTKTKGKKSKKKATAAVTAIPKETVPETDWIQELEHPPSIPNDWDSTDTEDGNTIITDEQILATLAMPLQTLRMYVTIYQMYARASAVAGSGNHELILKSFLSSLRLLLDPSFDLKLEVLSSMQVSALQLARLSSDQSCLYTAWAARTALWQLEQLPKQPMNNDDEKARQRLAMLPRLAESLALKAVQQSSHGAEECLLYLATLGNQDKQEGVLQFLNQLLEQATTKETNSTAATTMALTRRQIQERRAEVLVKMNLQEEASKVYEELIRQLVDQWSYWKGCLLSRYRQSEETCESKMEDLVSSVLESCKGQHLPRAPFLMRVELAAVRIRGITSDASGGSFMSKKDKDLSRLQEAIVSYGTYWAPRASCAFSDLCPYVELFCRVGDINTDHALGLMEWAETMHRESSYMNQSMNDHKEKRLRLRSYLFSIKVMCKVVDLLDGTGSDRLPSWNDLVKEWQATTTWSAKDETQKENQPGDELMLVAVKILLQSGNDTTNDGQHALKVAATLLEMALHHSPYNAHLIISAMNVYSRLNAVFRSFELYQNLAVKHVQFESCSYLVLPMLVEGGMYSEALEESRNVLTLHGNSLKDTGDYMALAMEEGTLSKANEFLVFQQQRMNPSIAMLDAKARIMDCAPFVQISTRNKKNGDKDGPRPIAVQHGIIGGQEDMLRATNMIKEAHMHIGAPNIVTLVHGNSAEVYSDNRDLTILSHQTMQPITPLSKGRTVSDSLRSGHIHGLLIRAALCVDACKGPKKGKVQKPTEDLEKRCESLLAAATSASDFTKRIAGELPLAYPELLQVIVSLCRILVVVCSGMPHESEKDDSLSNRERQVSNLLPRATLQVQSAKTILDLTSATTNASVASVCQLLPHCLVGIFAMLQMTADVFSTFGWGKRKRKTKSSAGALADFALTLRESVVEMSSVLSSLPSDTAEANSRIMTIVDSFANYVEEGTLDDAIAKGVAEHIVYAQRASRDRVVPYLDDIIKVLDSFDVTDEL